MAETRGRWRLLAASILALSASLAGAATAQTPAPADPNITPYAPGYFTEFRPVTALDMISRIPGFQFDGGSSARGFAGTAGNVLIDGERPPTRSDALSTVLSRIPASQVLRIDIVRAGAGGIDMQGKAVVANVIRRPDAGVTGAVSVNASVSDRGHLSPGLSIQAQRQRDGRSLDGALQLNMGESEGEGSRVRIAPNGQVLLRADSRNENEHQSAQATTVYEGPLAGGRIRANALVAWNAGSYAGFDTLIIPTGEERSTSDNDSLKGEAGLRWTRNLPRGMTLELVGFQQLVRSNGDFTYDTPVFTSDTLSETRSGESIASAALKFAPMGRWSFETGSEIALNWVESSSAFRFNNSPVLLPGDDTRVEELRSESFATGVWAPRPGLSVETTLRYEASRITATGSGGDAETQLSFLKPRLNVAWTPAPGHQVNLKIERNADQLSFGAFTASASFNTGIFGRGNPELRPAQVWLAQARYERVYDRQGSFVAELTHEQIDDVLGQVIVTETPPGAPGPIAFNITRNVGGATRDTLKLSNRQPLDRFGLTGGILSSSLQWRRSQTQDPVTFVDRRLSGEQPFSWSLGLSQNLVVQRISWNVNVSSGIEVMSFAPRTLSGFSTGPSFHAGVTYRPDTRLSISGSLFVSDGFDSQFTLFNAPRPAGAILYEERSTSPGQIQASISVRRAF
ncbi:MAG: hypothetical protein M3Q74_12560 [Pseudomonadota bacterium]|nr:hypothetical protein [Pseudomonadota bacterium]